MTFFITTDEDAKKLRCLSLANLSSLVCHLEVRTDPKARAPECPEPNVNLLHAEFTAVAK